MNLLAHSGAGTEAKYLEGHKMALLIYKVRKPV
jgi:hypothetical protein